MIKEIVDNRIHLYVETIKDLYDICYNKALNTARYFPYAKHCTDSSSSAWSVQVNGLNPFYLAGNISSTSIPSSILCTEDVPEELHRSVPKVYIRKVLIDRIPMSDNTFVVINGTHFNRMYFSRDQEQLRQAGILDEHNGELYIKDVTYMFYFFNTDDILEIHKIMYPTERHQIFLTHTQPMVHVPISKKFDADKLAVRIRTLGTTIINDYRSIIKHAGTCAPFLSLVTSVTNKLINAACDVVIAGCVSNMGKKSLANRKTLLNSLEYPTSIEIRTIDLLEALTYAPMLAEIALKRMIPNFSPEDTNSPEKAALFQPSLESAYLVDNMLRKDDRATNIFQLAYSAKYKNMISACRIHCNLSTANCVSTLQLSVEEMVERNFFQTLIHWYHTIIRFTDVVWNELFRDSPLIADLVANKSLEELKSISTDELVNIITTKWLPIRKQDAATARQVRTLLSFPSPEDNGIIWNTPVTFPTSANPGFYKIHTALSGDYLEFVRSLKENNEDLFASFYAHLAQQSLGGLEGLPIVETRLKNLPLTNSKANRDELAQHFDVPVYNISNYGLHRCLERCALMLITKAGFPTWHSNSAARHEDRSVLSTRNSHFNIKCFEKPNAKDSYTTKEGKHGMLTLTI